jgi:3-phenylpropionate/trans-cinnamate dioxygenase ferredoxin reductase subunit
MDASQLAMRGQDVLAKKQINLTTHTRVTAIDRAAKTVALADGSQLPYTGLVLATGSRPRLLSLPGAHAQGVLALRTQDDANQVADGLARCAELNRPLVVIGGGFIGLEVAATARKKGIAVTVLEAAPRLLGRVLAPALSDWFADLHRNHGVELVLNTQISQLTTGADGWVSGVQLADGTQVPAGLVLVGIGALANDELAADAGIACDRGILVDACGRTSDPARVRRRRLRGPQTGRRHNCCGWNRYKTPPNRARAPPPPCWARSAPSPPRPGSGATSTTKNCRWRA